jgi:hypothetical protein
LPTTHSHDTRFQSVDSSNTTKQQSSNTTVHEQHITANKLSIVGRVGSKIRPKYQEVKKIDTPTHCDSGDKLSEDKTRLLSSKRQNYAN